MIFFHPLRTIGKNVLEKVEFNRQHVCHSRAMVIPSLYMYIYRESTFSTCAIAIESDKFSESGTLRSSRACSSSGMLGGSKERATNGVCHLERICVVSH